MWWDKRSFLDRQSLKYNRWSRRSCRGSRRSNTWWSSAGGTPRRTYWTACRCSQLSSPQLRGANQSSFGWLKRSRGQLGGELRASLKLLSNKLVHYSGDAQSWSSSHTESTLSMSSRDLRHCPTFHTWIINKSSASRAASMSRISGNLCGEPSLNSKRLQRENLPTCWREVQQEMEFSDQRLMWIWHYAVDVTLDPDTAHRSLTLYDDGKEAREGKWQKRPFNQKKFTGLLGASVVADFTYRCKWKGRTNGLSRLVRECRLKYLTICQK